MSQALEWIVDCADCDRQVQKFGPDWVTTGGKHLCRACMQKYIDGDICRNCFTRPATMDWVGDGGAMAFIHGMTTRWCEYCATVAQLEHAHKMAALIPELEQKLATLR